ncbi:Plastidial lipoyltransferase 2 [Quillaja saponaria]|uniref:Plastidial lipoyltransferase 2 n=1 Tax=Quillaja saponaria TaxID=32244 RepID=A0AAD7PDA2_QUISA|nr:Plastidial lipoyltransferase 2 [Quillaja saponaria]
MFINLFNPVCFVSWSWQKEIVKEKKAQIERDGDCTDTLIVMQHLPVYTLGASSSEENLNFEMKDAPFDIYQTERGGEVTYHGPVQACHLQGLHVQKHIGNACSHSSASQTGRRCLSVRELCSEFCREYAVEGVFLSIQP